MVKVISYIHAESFELTKAFDYRIIAVNICLCFLYKCGYLHVLFFFSHAKTCKPMANTCNGCQKIFTKSHLLKRHKKICEKNTYKCEKCDKEFSLKRNLVRHEDFCLQGREYACSKCESTFCYQSNLHRHLKDRFLFQLFI